VVGCIVVVGGCSGGCVQKLFADEDLEIGTTSLYTIQCVWTGHFFLSGYSTVSPHSSFHLWLV
jgi:hypothetical protein